MVLTKDSVLRLVVVASRVKAQEEMSLLDRVSTWQGQAQGLYPALLAESAFTLAAVVGSAKGTL